MFTSCIRLAIFRRVGHAATNMIIMISLYQSVITEVLKVEPDILVISMLGLKSKSDVFNSECSLNIILVPS